MNSSAEKTAKNSIDNTVVVFDVETTGIDPARDQIIELCVQFGIGPGAEQQVWRFKPAVPISKEAEAIHGISIEDLADCPDFGALSETLREIFEQAEVIIGYNLEFDLKFLQAELRRAADYDLELKSKKLVDPYCIWRKMEPRSLTHAHRRFVGEEFEGAHAAKDDVRATGKVLRGMIKSFDLPADDWSKLADISGLKFDSWIGPSGHFIWSKGVAVFGFGKCRNRPILEVAEENSGSYLKWIIGSDFPEHVKAIAKSACSSSVEEFNSWLRQTYGSSSGDTR